MPPSELLDEPPPGLLTGASLFLDFDGTLVDIAAHPDAVLVDARLPPLLDALAARLRGRLAIVSGRPVSEIRRFFPGSLAISGSHGLEVEWPDGRRAAPDVPVWLGEAVARARAVSSGWHGVLVEEKPFGVALHYRQAPEAESACRAWAATLAGADRLVQPGKMVFEVRASGADKGGAVRKFVADASMAGSRPVFVGDDLTDEPAFHAARELGGAGVLVGEPRETAARYRLPGVADTIAWLERAAKGT